MLSHVCENSTCSGVNKRTFHFQVSLAQMEYQLPRLTKMWSHLERQSGGQVKGMGEKQIEVDKRILRDQVCRDPYFANTFSDLLLLFYFFLCDVIVLDFLGIGQIRGQLVTL